MTGATLRGAETRRVAISDGNLCARGAVGPLKGGKRGGRGEMKSGNARVARGQQERQGRLFGPESRLLK